MNADGIATNIACLVVTTAELAQLIEDIADMRAVMAPLPEVAS